MAKQNTKAVAATAPAQDATIDSVINAIETAKPGSEQAPAETSAPLTKLQQLEAAAAAAEEAIMTATPETRRAAIVAAMNAMNAVEQQKVEDKKAAIQQDAIDKRNARVKMLDDVIAAHDAYNEWKATNPAPAETFEADGITVHPLHAAWLAAGNEAAQPYNIAREAVVNVLIGSVPKVSAPATAGLSSTGTAPARGEKGKAIADILLSSIAAGKSVTDAKKAAETAGYARGTVGSIATELIKSGEIKA